MTISDYEPVDWQDGIAPPIDSQNLLKMEDKMVEVVTAVQVLETAPAYDLPPANAANLGGIKFEVIENEDGEGVPNGTFTGRIYI